MCPYHLIEFKLPLTASSGLVMQKCGMLISLDIEQYRDSICGTCSYTAPSRRLNVGAKEVAREAVYRILRNISRCPFITALNSGEFFTRTLFVGNTGRQRGPRLFH